ncbi:hypothetical protein AAZX31_10G123900 [Glycine max]
MFITKAYRTLRDRGPYPADQVLKELEGSFGFVIYDNKDGTIFVASGSNGQIGLYWGVAIDSSIVISENMEHIKASCAKSFAPFPSVQKINCCFVEWMCNWRCNMSKSIFVGECTLNWNQALPNVKSENNVKHGHNRNQKPNIHHLSFAGLLSAFIIKEFYFFEPKCIY